MKMFQYLNQKQISDMMFLFCIGDTLEKIISTWVEHENFTKEEAKLKRMQLEEEKRLAIEEKKNKVSKRSIKKKANRYDKDEDGYTYNFEPKKK